MADGTFHDIKIRITLDHFQLSPISLNFTELSWEDYRKQILDRITIAVEEGIDTIIRDANAD